MQKQSAFHDKHSTEKDLLLIFGLKREKKKNCKKIDTKYVKRAVRIHNLKAPYSADISYHSTSAMMYDREHVCHFLSIVFLLLQHGFDTIELI